MGSEYDLLRDLDLKRICVAAGIDEKGQLIPVGKDKFENLTTLLPWTELLVVAEDQSPFSNPEFNYDTRLHVLKATSLKEAIQKIWEEVGPLNQVRKYELDNVKYLSLLGGNQEHLSTSTYYRQLRLLPRSIEDNLPITLAELFNVKAGDEGAISRTRAVILGGPGSGKTTLLQYVSWQALYEQGFLHKWRFLPVRINLYEWLKEEKPLPEFLQSTYLKHLQGTESLPSVMHWEHWLKWGNVLLLVDGLDNLEWVSPFPERFRAALDTYEKMSVLVTCRTFDYEQRRLGFREYVLDTLNQDDQIRMVNEHPATRGNQNLLKEIRSYLEDIRISELANKPFFLDMLCYSMARNHYMVKSVGSLSDLYRTFVNLLFETPHPTIETEKIRHILEQACFKLSAVSNVSRLIFDEKGLFRELSQSAKEQSQGFSDNDIISIINYLESIGFIYMKDNFELTFFHDSIHEYLTSSWLNKCVSQSNWLHARLSPADKGPTLRMFLNKIAWSPKWHEILIFLVGQLKDPFPLIWDLSQDSKDDIFCHRRGLAIICLYIVFRRDSAFQKESKFTELLNLLTTQIMDVWRKFEMPELEHLRKVVALLFVMNGYDQHLHSMVQEGILNELSKEGQVKSLSKTLSILDSKILDERVTPELVRMLRMESPLPKRALLLIQAIGGRVSGAKFVQELVELAKRSPALRKPVFDALTALEELDNPVVRELWSDFLDQGTSIKQRCELIESIVSKNLLEPDDRLLGPLFETLKELNVHQNPMLRWRGQAILRSIQNNPDPKFQRYAASIKSSQGVLPEGPLVIDFELERLSANPEQQNKLISLYRIADSANFVSNGQIDKIAELLSSEDDTVRERATQILSRVHALNKAVHPSLNGLLSLLDDHSRGIRLASLQVIVQFAKHFANDNTLINRLLLILRKNDSEANLYASHALYEMGLQISDYHKVVKALLDLPDRLRANDIEEKLTLIIGTLGGKVIQDGRISARFKAKLIRKIKNSSHQLLGLIALCNAGCLIFDDESGYVLKTMSDLMVSTEM